MGPLLKRIAQSRKGNKITVLGRARELRHPVSDATHVNVADTRDPEQSKRGEIPLKVGYWGGTSGIVAEDLAYIPSNND